MTLLYKHPTAIAFAIVAFLLLILNPAPTVFAADSQDPEASLYAASWVQDALGTEIIPEGCRTGTQPRTETAEGKPCGIPEIMQTIVNITRLMLGVMGSAALLMLVYGGVMFIVSSGNQDKVNKAKNILIAAILGIVIILTAWSIVNLILLALTQGGVSGTGEVFDRPWTTPQR